MKLVYIALLAVLGCGATQLNHPTPKGFVELDARRPYHYRAVTADGLVLAARVIDHDPKGEVTFWTTAVANQLRRAGYALLEERDVETDAGLAGKQLRFGHDEGQRPHLYYVTLFVTDSNIYVLEAGGTKKQIEASSEQIDWAIKNFRTK